MVTARKLEAVKQELAWDDRAIEYTYIGREYKFHNSVACMWSMSPGIPFALYFLSFPILQEQVSLGQTFPNSSCVIIEVWEGSGTFEVYHSTLFLFYPQVEEG